MLKIFVKHIIKTIHVSVTIVWPSSGGRLSCLVLLIFLCLFASSSCLFGMWLYVVCNIMFALEWFHDFIYQDMKKLKHMTKRGIDLHMCVCVSDVLVCEMFGCELSLIACGSYASSYNGFGSLNCCSVMSRFCWRYIWMYRFS
jgi:hypothetical protein